MSGNVRKILEEFKNKMREELQRIEDSYREQIEQLESRYDLERRFYEEILDVINKILLGQKPVESIVEITCGKNLAYCCSLEKNCPLRNLALAVLGIDFNEYKEIKEMFGRALTNPEKRKKLKEFLSSL